MKRLVFAAVPVILLLAVATPVNAGYLIIRVILDSGSSASGGTGGSGGTGLTTPGPGGGRPFGPGAGPGPGGKGGSSQGPPGGYNYGSSGYGKGSSGFGKGMGGQPENTTSGPSGHDPTRSIVIVIPITEDLTIRQPFYPKNAPNSLKNPPWRPKVHVVHQGQRYSTNLFADNATVQLYDPLLRTPAARRTRTMEVEDLHRDWTRSDKTNSRLLLTVLTSALEAGMVTESVGYADELLQFTVDNPNGLSPEVTAFARAYKSMQRGIKSPAGKPNDAEDWRQRLRAPSVATQSHYSLIYWDASSAEVQRRLAMLEENFKGFFLWHASRGIELPIPDAPLVAILPKSGNEVIRCAYALDFPGRLQADGFYSAEHDVLVLSPERLDEIGLTFARQAQQIYQAGITRDRLLSGDGPKLHVNGEGDAKRPEEVARMQTIALVDRLSEDLATMDAISREGSRQLLYHTGQLPKYVVLPQWFENGSVAFFTRAKDSAFITDAEGKMSVSVPIITGYGGPNHRLQRYFKDLQDKKELHPDSGVLLKNILTDAYFRGLRDPKEATDPDPTKTVLEGIAAAGGKGPSGSGNVAIGGRPNYGTGLGSRPGPGSIGPPSALGPGSSAGGPPGGLGGKIGGTGAGTGTGTELGQPSEVLSDDPDTILRKKRDRLGIKAHSTAWALCYYLEKAKPADLRKFQDELAALPRDLPLDGDTVVTVFCRSFGIENNKDSLRRFANGWLEYMRTVTPGSFDVKLVDVKPPSAGSTGGSPLGPGGSGPAPGGGN